MGRSQFYTSPATRTRNLKRTIKFLHKKVKTLTIPPAKRCLAISQPIVVDIPPSAIPKQLSFAKLVMIDIPPVEECIPRRPEQAVPVQEYVPDVRDYPQHVLDDLDPQRELKRQENVKTTLRMIDDALRFSR